MVTFGAFVWVACALVLASCAWSIRRAMAERRRLGLPLTWGPPLFYVEVAMACVALGVAAWMLWPR